MPYPTDTADPGEADDHVVGGHSLATVRRLTSISEVIPIGPNVFANFASFIALLIVPWGCLHILEMVWEGAIGADLVVTLFTTSNLRELLVTAFLGALLFLVIGAVLQTWHHHRPFPWRRPILLAFPIAWGLIMPEALLDGGSMVSDAVVGTAIALAFCVHWGTLWHLSDTMG